MSARFLSGQIHTHTHHPCICIHAGDLTASCIAPLLLEFWRFFHLAAPASTRGALSVRDLLSWVAFINATAPALGDLAAYAHGAHLTLLDGIGLGVGVPPATAAFLRARCHARLMTQLSGHDAGAQLHAALASGDLTAATRGALVASGRLDAAPPPGTWGMPPFCVPLSDAADAVCDTGFSLAAPTTAANAFRVLRALQVRKAVLLEGSPGVGKTTLVGGHAVGWEPCG